MLGYIYFHPSAVVFLVLHLSFEFPAQFMPPTEPKGLKEEKKKKKKKNSRKPKLHSIGIFYQDEKRKKNKSVMVLLTIAQQLE